MSFKMFLSLRSFTSGRICRCFSRDCWRSMGEMGVSSMFSLGAVVSAMVAYFELFPEGCVNRGSGAFTVSKRAVWRRVNLETVEAVVGQRQPALGRVF